MEARIPLVSGPPLTSPADEPAHVDAEHLAGLDDVAHLHLPLGDAVDAQRGALQLVALVRLGEGGDDGDDLRAHVLVEADVAR